MSEQTAARCTADQPELPLTVSQKLLNFTVSSKSLPPVQSDAYLHTMNVQSIASTIIILTGLIVMLILGQSLIVPFIFALIIWLLIRRIKKQLNKLPFIRKWFPGWLTNVVMSLIIFGCFAFIGRVLTDNIESLAQSYERYEANLEGIMEDISHLFGINVGSMLKDYIVNFNFGKFFAALFNSLSGIVGNFVVILLYIAFIFLEETNFPAKVRAIFPRNTQHKKVIHLSEKIEDSVASYIGLKTLVNLASATCSFFILWGVGVQSPIFWAFLMFLLNFIPVIGMFGCVLLPSAFALIQFGTWTPVIVLLSALGVIQFVSGNILEPRVMGNSLNISPLVALVALAFWGMIWGITGMFLSVPVTVIMIIIFSQFDKTKPIAILLSEKGNI